MNYISIKSQHCTHLFRNKIVLILITSWPAPHSLSLTASDVAAELEREMAEDSGLLALKHYHSREYSGMYEYKCEDEPKLIQNLVTGRYYTLRKVNYSEVWVLTEEKLFF